MVQTARYTIVTIGRPVFYHFFGVFYHTFFGGEGWGKMSGWDRAQMKTSHPDTWEVGLGGGQGQGGRGPRDG